MVKWVAMINSLLVEVIVSQFSPIFRSDDLFCCLFLGYQLREIDFWDFTCLGNQIRDIGFKILTFRYFRGNGFGILVCNRSSSCLRYTCVKSLF